MKNSRIRIDTAQPRSGFTLIELLVVIGIIAILISLTAAVFGTLFGTARSRTTRATIRTVGALIDERLRQLDIAIEQGRHSDEITVLENALTTHLAGLGSPPANPSAVAELLAPIIFRKQKMRSAFPVPGTTSAADASEQLYDIITNGAVFGMAPVANTEFDSNQLGDTDVDGNPEFVDGWGNPIRFYLWASRLIRPAGYGGAIDSDNTSMLFTGIPANLFSGDPDDPVGDLNSAIETNDWLQGFAGGEFDDRDAFEFNFHTLDAAHPFLLVSAGPDGDLGLREPGVRTVSSEYGHLAEPTVTGLDSALNDNITNHQQTGGN